ncbi:MAG: hypothetical protein AAF558_06215 [Verrucomicrobiota bacterium]
MGARDDGTYVDIRNVNWLAAGGAVENVVGIKLTQSDAKTSNYNFLSQ